MDLRREIALTMLALVACSLLLAFGSIGLFVRMGPAIDRILQENAFSILAAEEILTELAQADDGPLKPRARSAIRDALTAAKSNVTEDSEPPVLEKLQASIPRVVEGDEQAKLQAVDLTRSLIQINWRAMRQAGDEAHRLGTAGAWAAFFVGLTSFLLSLLVVVRLQHRVVTPLVDLFVVLEEAREGDHHRRCHAGEAPREVLQVMESVNQMLDERLHRDDDHRPLRP